MLKNGSGLDWPLLFLDAMTDLDPRMHNAMQANGCREGWLQAELMMAASARNIALWTNTEKMAGSSKRHDLAAYDAEDRPTMVAELKIMYGWDQTKCLTGGGTPSWKDFVPQDWKKRSRLEDPKKKESRLVTPQEIDQAKGNAWGLLPDAGRLMLHPAAERYLILILRSLETVDGINETTPERVTKLQAAMDAVAFSDRSDRFWGRTFKSFAIKIWQV
jgi:hypothetical protein